MTTEYGHFKCGAWVPEKIILHAWRYHCEDLMDFETPQEAWDRAQYLEDYGEASCESIEIGERVFNLGCYTDDWGEETKRILREEYGVKIDD